MPRKTDTGDRPYVYMADAAGVNHGPDKMGTPRTSYENRRTSPSKRGWLWGREQAADHKDLEFKRLTEGNG